MLGGRLGGDFWYENGYSGSHTSLGVTLGVSSNTIGVFCSPCLCFVFVTDFQQEVIITQVLDNHFQALSVQLPG